jgi:hypothetical protein
MRKLNFTTETGKCIQIVLTMDDVTDDADYFIYYKDREKFLDTAKLLMSKFRTKKVTKKVAQELINRNLLWKN